MEKILITGGAGFIGSHLIRHLINEDVSLRVLDQLSPQIHGALPMGLGWLDDGRIEFVRGSVTERRVVEEAMRGVTQIVHLAAETGTGQSMYEIVRYNKTNSQGTAVLLDVLSNASNRSVRRIVLASSRAVYGEGAYVCKFCDSGGMRVFPGIRTAEQLRRHQWEPLCPNCLNPVVSTATRESDPVRPVSIYAATKHAQEDLVRIACESLDIDYAILRLQNVYGEGQSLLNPYTGILSIFSSRARQRLELAVFEDGEESRDFVHVDDVVRIMGRCLTSVKPINTIVNLGSGVGTSMMEVANELTKNFGAELNVKITAQYRLGDIRHNVADLSRLKSMFEYKPLVTLDVGLRRLVEWVQTQPVPEDLLHGANAELRARKLMD